MAAELLLRPYHGSERNILGYNARGLVHLEASERGHLRPRTTNLARRDQDGGKAAGDGVWSHDTASDAGHL